MSALSWRRPTRLGNTRNARLPLPGPRPPPPARLRSLSLHYYITCHFITGADSRAGGVAEDVSGVGPAGGLLAYGSAARALQTEAGGWRARGQRSSEPDPTAMRGFSSPPAFRRWAPPTTLTSIHHMNIEHEVINKDLL
ncbi:hypothetical protein EYF80_054783 [Liparis tanakae]|uniref:Uncharacterized protein n=1 Tax=Liparis tanakae TaxID=230148 RepID=A0A4Z2F1Z1_9TELE|nr:hypothetical protein EYF80_054783 [Liparis tanakae]